MKYTSFYLKNIDTVRLRSIPQLISHSKNAIVMIDSRPDLNHIEFVLRHSYSHLANNMWAAYFFCTDANQEWATSMCAKISPEISVCNIQTMFNRDIKNHDDYNNLMLSKRLWRFFKEQNISKVFILHEDALIFRKGIEKFLKYDYIGAPWPLNHRKSSSLGFGSGGFAIRNVDMTLKLLDETYQNRIIAIRNIHSTSKHLVKNHIPEDVYYSIGFYLLRLDLGVMHVDLPNIEVAQEFAIEHTNHKHPYGGHKYWLSRKDFSFIHI